MTTVWFHDILRKITLLFNQFLLSHQYNDRNARYSSRSPSCQDYRRTSPDDNSPPRQDYRRTLHNDSSPPRHFDSRTYPAITQWANLRCHVVKISWTLSINFGCNFEFCEKKILRIFCNFFKKIVFDKKKLLFIFFFN